MKFRIQLQLYLQAKKNLHWSLHKAQISIISLILLRIFFFIDDFSNHKEFSLLESVSGMCLTYFRILWDLFWRQKINKRSFFATKAKLLQNYNLISLRAQLKLLLNGVKWKDLLNSRKKKKDSFHSFKTTEKEQLINV